ncbi:SNF2 family N-terminal domain-containing protein [Irpex rosettiformis]|uniref:SNF2 family N-terminal domain-containing protein n=1 Tax=Irpex rosettiformis TaxID=378272 RepID=A0ACB8UG58_9APHY|nr:SNF2 family N-terminal domain-containing protein [Irpex rosettiformis]
MPAFQTPVVLGSAKRRLAYDDSNLPANKRQAVSNESGNGVSTGSRSYWMVQWRSPQQKKHKTWDGDGVLIVKGTFFDLLDAEDGRRIACGKPSGVEIDKIGEGSEFSLGGRELLVDHPVKASEYLAGTCFANGAVVNATESSSSSILRNSATAVKQFTPLKPRNGLNFKAPSFVRSNSTASSLHAAAPKPTGSSQSANVTEASMSQAQKDTFWMPLIAQVRRKPQQRKHKTWDGDAYLIHRGNLLTLVSEKGLILGKKKCDGTIVDVGYSTTIGNKEVEVDSRISKTEIPTLTGNSAEYENDEDFGDTPQTQPHAVDVNTKPLHVKGTALFRKDSRSTSVAVTPNSTSTKKSVSASSFYAHAPPKPKPKGPLHDPDSEGAIVMLAPSPEHIAKYNKRNAPVVPVVIDPVLARRLRQHQVEGVKFMYECVMAMKGHDGRGCILADEMGMGKTLQTITLVWTLLKQNPYAGIGPVVGKVLIVCPVSLINNWKSEFHKWLGRDRVGIFAGDKDKALVKQFVNSRIHHVLIIGYERLRTVINDVSMARPPIGLIICDEGHRLKSANNKTSTMFEALSTTRRIILSGTPIQNDLGEFHAMADFCNPGLLGNDKGFKKIYEVPILKSRAPDCTSKEKELGKARLEQLLEVSKTFVLRREAIILKKFLPPKHEYVVFIAPTKLQRDIFHKILTAEKLDSLVRNSTADSLALISMLTKISNSPILLKAALDQANERGNDGSIVKSSVVSDAVQYLPMRAQIEDVSLSGKLAALANLLRAIYKTTDEKCIIVSHYTSTLSIIEAFCKKKNYSYNRLDGTTPGPKRQEYVNDFNKSSQKQRFIFLLSSKAGGVGLNLIGASRLCLIDSDWNPSHDLQSMARIHRDGQKRPVYIYRFLTAGSIDEKIYQRQVTKLGLSDCNNSKSDSFTRKELRDIFTIHANTACHTHDLLECPCRTGSSGPSSFTAAESEAESGHRSTSGSEAAEEDSEKEMGFINASAMDPAKFDRMDQEYLKQKKAQLAALGQWKHINCLRRKAREQIRDEILQKLVYVPPDEEESDEDEDGGPSSLLDALDLDRVLKETRPALAVDGVPGGSVSFLFERTSETQLEDAGEAGAEES